MKTVIRWLLQYLPVLLPTGLSSLENVHVARDLAAQTVIGTNDYPQTAFLSTKVTTPVVDIVKWDESCDSESFVLLGPHGRQIADNKILLLDNRGELVWYHNEKGAVHNIQVQEYKGNRYITYWVGDDDYFGHGSGYYKMYDHTYNLAYTLTAGNGLDGDYHEFSITPQNTALITSFVKTPWDLSAHGREKGFIWDCVFQELEVETNKVLFEWRASKHFHFNDMAINSWAAWTGHTNDPWDWMHLNSVEKDAKGNYLIAARNTKAITYICGKTGKRLWQLGGVRNSFKDLSNGDATTFTNPHTARWNPYTSSLTLFDNIDHRTANSNPQSRGVSIQLDTRARTATVATDLSHPHHILANRGGSLQRLSNNNHFISYGSAPVYSEFSPSGEHLCETHWAPMHNSTSGGILTSPDVVDTFRVYKAAWSARPAQPPVVKYTAKTMYLHWNGATQVRSWRIEARAAENPRYRRLGHYRHDGFELTVPFQLDAEGAAKSYVGYRMTALDAHGAVLGVWKADARGKVVEIEGPSDRDAGWGTMSYGLLLAAVTVWGVWRKWRKWSRRGSVVELKEKVSKC